VSLKNSGQYIFQVAIFLIDDSFYVVFSSFTCATQRKHRVARFTGNGILFSSTMSQTEQVNELIKPLFPIAKKKKNTNNK